MCVCCPGPALTEEAKKAKFQGTVALNIIVQQPDGRATNFDLVKSVGLGLDEKAIEAVRSWRFKPAVGPNSRPVAVVIPIEVAIRSVP